MRMIRLALSLAAFVFSTNIVNAADAAQLRLTVLPNPATIDSTLPVGTVIANITASWNNGRPFTGIVKLNTPNTPFVVVGNKFLTVFNPIALKLAAGQTFNLDIQATE